MQTLVFQVLLVVLTMWQQEYKKLGPKKISSPLWLSELTYYKFYRKLLLKSEKEF